MALFKKRRRTPKAGERPLIQIMEKHEPTTTGSGPGVRSCTECGRTWLSMLGQLADTGKLADYRSRGEVRIYASWEETIGLTCTSCRRSRCLDHTPPPTTSSGVPQATDHPCPTCNAPLDHG
ncbi:hypothetical protein [Actinophytocola gossypii]|uniref:Uncharacterized protein n=1 Tax=Actinophytocola gossypii TaxID=2812003 RepID=A0ABT2J6L1_9PSEU|nr:hypothetical protein [Actinophytocola gossypii]MCT2582909.1 hypothetical protein [Actinophytocola gossypii]